MVADAVQDRVQLGQGQLLVACGGQERKSYQEKFCYLETLEVAKIVRRQTFAQPQIIKKFLEPQVLRNFLVPCDWKRFW